MSENELLELLSTIKIHYSFFKVDRDLERAWYKVMHNFSFEDVEKNLEIAMADVRFQKEPPTAYYLIQGLVPVHKKINFENRIVFCPICKRALNQEEEKKHQERCSSVRYIITQYKKWSNKDLNKHDLYEMSEEEFKKIYKKLLNYIYEHTKDEHEKTRIGFIFNPPSTKVAKNFLGGINDFKRNG